jgi:hypothetical protein
MTNVMHVSQVAGKSAVHIVTPDGELTSAWIGDVFKAHFAKVIAEGEGWAPDDEYKVVTRCSTWPMGWEKEGSTKYFKSKEELDEHVESYREWALCEDNMVKISVWEWDLGPTFKEELCFG